LLAAADSAEDQVKIGEILAAHGGGHFLSTIGVQPGAKLPLGFTDSFHQFMDDYLDPKNKEFTEWRWWNYLEDAFINGRLKELPVEVMGGLSQVQAACNLLHEGKASSKRLIVRSDCE